MTIKIYYSVPTKGVQIIRREGAGRNQLVAETLAVTLLFHFSEENGLQ
jgi:hypothetical protein